MIKKIDHVAVAVPNLAEGIELFRKLLGSEPSEPEMVEEQKVRVVFFNVGGVHIELLEPISDDSPIAGFIAKNGSGIHHIAFESDDINSKISELIGSGLRMIDEKPRAGAGGRKIAFLHPKSTLKMLTEICQ